MDLDDYEEGSWTPELMNNTPPQFSQDLARYRELQCVYDPTGTDPNPKPHLGCHCPLCEPREHQVTLGSVARMVLLVVGAVGFVVAVLLATGK